MSQREPTEEELQAAFEEQMRGISVEDVILQTAVTLVNLGGQRLGLAGPSGERSPSDRDLPQARLAVEGVRALVPLLPPEPAAAIRKALTQLHIAYAHEAGEAGGAEAAAGAGAPPTGPPPGAGGPGQAPPPPPGPAPAPPPEPTADEAERAKARAKIWLPGS